MAEIEANEIDNVEIQPYLYEPEYAEGETPPLLEQEHIHQVDDSSSEEENRLHDLESWCDCGNCEIMITERECRCCFETRGLAQHLRTGIGCITNHEDFNAVCLTRGVLEMLVRQMHELRGHVRNLQWTNRLYRLVGYRAFTYWAHGQLGKGNRRVIPSCVVTAIRRNFPEEDNNYQGFEAGTEVEDAWHL